MSAVLRGTAACVIGVAVLWLFTFGSFEPPARLSVPVGASLPEFRLPMLDDRLFESDTTFVTSADLRDDVALVAITCGSGCWKR